MFERFDTQDVQVADARIHTKIAGHGRPVLLLHGYPQTHAMWHQLGPRLAEEYRVVVADLRGYGRSIAHSGDFSFRAMAADMVEVMGALGMSEFDVVAHDRGARTAHRMILDHPDRVRTVVLLDILPTLRVWELMDSWLGRKYYHWFFLSQPAPMPEHLINGDPVTFLHSALGGLSGPLEVFDPEALAAYEEAARNPAVVAAWCGDYTAGATIDVDHDQADLGRTSPVPALVLWGSKGVVGAQTDPIAAWKTWLPNAYGHQIEAGHFLVEEQPETVLTAVRAHLARGSHAAEGKGSDDG